jgi:putative transposase
MASYSTDVSEAAWALIQPHLPQAKTRGRPRSTDLRRVVNAIFYLLRTGCQWRLLPRCFRLGARSITISASGWERACG